MALDFTLLDADGQPSAFVPIGVEEHWRMVTHANAGPLVGRMADYYEDAEYTFAELPALLSEFVAIRTRDVELADLIERLERLGRKAVARQTRIMVIAD